MPARQPGSPRQQCTGAISAFVDGIDSHIILGMIRESKRESKVPESRTHGSVCSDVRKLQSMNVLKLQSTEANWNSKCPFHILAYIYRNLLDISTSYFIKILSYRERLDIDSQRTPFIGFQG